MKELKRAIEKYIQDTIDHEWVEFSTHLTKNVASKREIIYRQTDICKKVIYILEGIAASEYNNEDKLIISRFFQSGNLCSNLSSATSRSIERDNVIAITNIKYIEIPFDYFMNLYLYSSSIGLFFRRKILEHLVDAKDFISIKTVANTELQYAFMEERYPEIIARTSSKYIAAFMGITPEALSRFLKNRIVRENR